MIRCIFGVLVAMAVLVSGQAFAAGQKAASTAGQQVQVSTGNNATTAGQGTTAERQAQAQRQAQAEGQAHTDVATRLTAEQRERAEEAERAALARARTAADSVRILYNLIDLEVDAKDRKGASEDLYQLAVRTGRDTDALCALRYLASATSRDDPQLDSIMRVYSTRAARMPKSADQRETQTFIEVLRLQKELMTMPEEERVPSLKLKLGEFANDNKVDVYRRIEILYTLCLYLSDRANSQLLDDYMLELEEILDKLPDEPGALKNHFYVMAAQSYSAVGNYGKAVEMNRRILELMAKLEKKYHDAGRKYRSYVTIYFSCYERMLGNYPGLEPGEAEDIYGKVLELVRTEPVVANMYNMLGASAAFLAMAKGEYAKAVPLLQKAVANPRNYYRKCQLLRMLVDAARKSGNRAALVEAYEEYTPMLETRMAATDAYGIIEYEILHNVNELMETNASLEAISLRSRQEANGRVRLWIITTIAALLLVIMVILYAYWRSRKQARRMDESNRALTRERDNMAKAQRELIAARDSAKRAELQKDDVISTLCHEITDPVGAIVGYSQLIVDSVDDKRRTAMERFSKIISLNAELVDTLVNDVVDTVQLETSKVVLKNRMVRMSELAEIAADSMRNRLQPGVTMEVSPIEGTDPDMTVNTDPTRAAQVLINLVSNAVKFTEKGHIDVMYGQREHSGRPVFVVQDTGPGIPHDKQELVFARYEKLSTASQGIGLGLYVSRLIARLLGAEVFVDPDYTDGTRMLFILPGEHFKN